MLVRRSIVLSRRPSHISHRFIQKTISRNLNQPPSHGNAGIIQETIANHAGTAFQAAGRFLKLSALGAVGVGVTVYLSYEASHQYVEHWGMAPESDDNVKEFQWHISEENWHGDPLAGGTDPGLGWKGRHLLRSAWIARNWGIGPAELYAPSAQGQGISPNLDMPTAQAAQFLKATVAIAEERLQSKQLHPLTLPELLNRYASLLERLGADHLPMSLESFQHAWEGYSGTGSHAARIALRLGDINLRLHRHDEAQKWWRKAIQVSQGSSHPEVGALLQPSHLPSSPWAQRIIASTLVSVSAFYAQSGKLSEAETFQEAALSFLRAIPTPESSTTVSPPQALHSLFILQRSSLISVHLAEVLHARGKPVASSIQWLTSAVDASERVACALSGTSLQGQALSRTSTRKPSQENQILPVYLSSKGMKNAASRLYRDAKRTSAEAWNLLGVLYEREEGPKSKNALECYERAVQWAGNSDASEAIQPNDATTHYDWGVFWSNFQRFKAASDNKK